MIIWEEASLLAPSWSEVLPRVVGAPAPPLVTEESESNHFLVENLQMIPPDLYGTS